MWGCKPTSVVDRATKMVKDVIETFEHRFDPQTLMLHIPGAFEHLKGSDSNFEMVTSNTIQPTRLEYSKNIITEKKAVIFINTCCNKIKSMDRAKQNEILAQTLADKAERHAGEVSHLAQKKLLSQNPQVLLEVIEQLPESERVAILRETFYLPWNNAIQRG